MGERRKEWLEEFDYFRGVCIFCIVYQHVLQHMGIDAVLDGTGNPVYRALYVLIYQSTLLFVFISGFLFHRVFYADFNYVRFMKNKVQKIFCPYLTIATALLIVGAAYKFFVLHTPITAKTFIHAYFYGSFWYIPFIMLVFLTAHIHLGFLKLKIKYQIPVLIFGLIVCIVLGRSNDPVYSFWGLSPFYLLGISYSQHYDFFKRLRPIAYIGILALYCVCLIFVIVDESFYFAHISHSILKNFPRYDYGPLYKILEILLALWIFNWLKRAVGGWPKTILSILAKYSFSIFFLHNVIFALPDFRRILPNESEHMLFGGGIAIACLVCVICIAVAFLVKKATGKKSRMIIGA